MLSENLQLTAVDPSLDLCTICIADLFQIYVLKLSFEMWSVRATTFIFDSRTDVLVKVSKFLKQKMSRPEGHSNSQSSYSCRMLQPFELSRPDICCPMFFNTGSECCIPNSWSINLVNKLSFILSLLTTRSRKSYEFSQNFISHHPCAITPFGSTAAFPGAIGSTMILTYIIKSNKSLFDSQYFVSQG